MKTMVLTTNYSFCLRIAKKTNKLNKRVDANMIPLGHGSRGSPVLGLATTIGLAPKVRSLASMFPWRTRYPLS